MSQPQGVFYHQNIVTQPATMQVHHHKSIIGEQLSNYWHIN